MAEARKFSFDTVLLERVTDAFNLYKRDKRHEPTHVVFTPEALGAKPGAAMFEIPETVMGLQATIDWQDETDRVYCAYYDGEPDEQATVFIPGVSPHVGPGTNN